MSAPRHKPAIPEIVPLVRAYYAKDESTAVGGDLHAVLDDGNIARQHLVWVIEHGRHEEGRLLARLLLLMSVTQRKRLSHMTFYPWADGVADGTPVSAGGDSSSLISALHSLVAKYDAKSVRNAG